MTTTAQGEGPRIVGDALAKGVAGDLEGGVDLLVLLIAGGWSSAYALAAMLAETASHIARRDQQPGTVFGMPVQNTETGEWASAEVLPPHVRFAAQFTTAWANRDRAHAEALFTALYERSAPDGSEMVDGLLMLFQMAVCTSEEVIAEERAKREQGSGS
ncbi:hypothetical protein HEP81_04589 [Streptomyces griseofuscus]|uniref:Uncharacterized protein n=1 Tax=Streptomyces griseofuscus TaxID=146922 RepID=A0A7H1Q3I2_9ACTN|nr:hypothetical protein [Streptomyces griseofuscus]QNT94862.1 hypothetical protein HEP81_04589 [Streptomyces griseofuscus]